MYLISTLISTLNVQELHCTNNVQVYNFGELLAHPLLEALRVACPWIVELLLAFNRGDMTRYVDTVIRNTAR